jgi:hypothetical protein
LAAADWAPPPITATGSPVTTNTASTGSKIDDNYVDDLLIEFAPAVADRIRSRA